MDRTPHEQGSPADIYDRVSELQAEWQGRLMDALRQRDEALARNDRLKATEAEAESELADLLAVLGPEALPGDSIVRCAAAVIRRMRADRDALQEFHGRIFDDLADVLGQHCGELPAAAARRMRDERDAALAKLARVAQMLDGFRVGARAYRSAAERGDRGAPQLAQEADTMEFVVKTLDLALEDGK